MASRQALMKDSQPSWINTPLFDHQFNPSKWSKVTNFSKLKDVQLGITDNQKKADAIIVCLGPDVYYQFIKKQTSYQN